MAWPVNVWINRVYIPSMGPWWDLLAWRSGNFQGGHLLDWFSIFAMATLASWWPYDKGQGPNGSRGVLVLGMSFFYHEGGWNVAAAISNFGYWLRNQLPGVKIFLVVSVVFTAIFVVRRSAVFRLFDKSVLLAVAISYAALLAVWVSTGFFVSVYGGATPWYSNNWVSLAEVSLWQLTDWGIFAAYVVRQRKTS